METLRFCCQSNVKITDASALYSQTLLIQASAPPTGGIARLTLRFSVFLFLWLFNQHQLIFALKYIMAVRLLSKLKALPELRSAATFSSSAGSAPAVLSDFDQQHKTPVIRKQKLIPVAHYGGRHAVSMLPGGGIGQECMGYVRDIFRYG